MSLVLRQKRVTVASAGSPKALSDVNLFTQAVIFSADPNNVGTIWVGDENVSASGALGSSLDPNETLELEGTDFFGTNERLDLSNYYVDADNDNDTLIVSYYERVKDEIITFFPNVKSLNLNGVDQAVNFGDAFDTTAATTRTFSAWVKPDDFAVQMCITSKTTLDANVFGIGIYTTASSGRIFVQVRATGQLRSLSSTNSLIAGDWSHVAVTYNGNQDMSGFKIYINGSLDPASTTGSISNLNENPVDFLFGRRGNSFYWKGNMNNNSIYNKELSASEVSEIYNNGKPASLEDFSDFSSIESWWKLNNDVNFPIEVDAVGTVDGTLENNPVYEEDVP